MLHKEAHRAVSHEYAVAGKIASECKSQMRQMGETISKGGRRCSSNGAAEDHLLGPVLAEGMKVPGDTNAMEATLCQRLLGLRPVPFGNITLNNIREGS